MKKKISDEIFEKTQKDVFTKDQLQFLKYLGIHILVFALFSLISIGILDFIVRLNYGPITSAQDLGIVFGSWIIFVVLQIIYIVVCLSLGIRKYKQNQNFARASFLFPVIIIIIYITIYFLNLV